MNAILWLIDSIINIVIMIVVIQVILSWLIAFNVVNMRNQFIATVANALYQLTEPLYRPLRNYLVFGGIDFSPIAIILGLNFIKMLLIDIFRAMG